ncbi:MAG TPA: glutathione S-transferase N-terminal domain-containing protein [Bacteriovoracaceae bacterium]|nr:glutathione S-transferase N-terminal domain-containing protein [Bacteriovoracaceae bacterium]
MKKKLELYFFPQCPFCQIVLSTLRTTGLESEVTLYDVLDEPHYKKKLIKDTGRGTVPCLYIDGKPMFESRDISNWLHGYAKSLQAGDELSGN